MNRFSIMYGIAVLAALAAVGCAAPTDPNTELGSNDDEIIRHAQLIDSNGTVTGNGTANNNGVTTQVGGHQSPSPDPWAPAGGEGDPESPSPDPWHPNARMFAPGDPDNNGNTKK